MRIFLTGSTQIQHIEKIYKACGWKVYIINESNGRISQKLKNLFYVVFSDIVYSVGGKDYRKDNILKVAKYLNKKIVMHWIGTDVMHELQRFKESGEITNNGIIHLAVSEQLREELTQAMVNSIYVPIVPAAIPYPPAPEMPLEHSVLVYLPKNREDFYGWPEVRFLAERYNDIKFYVVANDGTHLEKAPENIKFLGFLEPAKLYELFKKTSVLLRYTKHDGLPVMMLEAQGMGRAVIHRYNFPHVLSPANDSLDALIKVFDQLVSSPPKLDLEAKKYVDQNFCHEKILEIYKRHNLV